MTTRDIHAPIRPASHDAKPSDATGAIFGSREEARGAIASLHKNHFLDTWSGITSLAVKDGGEVVAIEQPGFFSLKSQTLVDALVEHGIQAETANGIEPGITAGETIVIVTPGDRDANEAQQLLQDAGGEPLESALTRGAQRNAGRVSSSADNFAGMSEDDDPVYVEEIFYFTGRA
jgi:hypothetical protein